MSGLPEALETAREAGEVLSAAVLSQENAEGLDGSGLDFRDCRFQSCRLRNCDFTGAAFYGCTFTGCLLENCRLSATYWKDCRLSGCKWVRGPAPLPVEGQRSGGDSASLCQLFRRRLGAYFREGM